MWASLAPSKQCQETNYAPKWFQNKQNQFREWQIETRVKLFSSSPWTASMKLLGGKVRGKIVFMNSWKPIHLIVKEFNSLTWAILLQITCESKEPEVICSCFSQTPGHLPSSKATDSTVLSNHITLPFEVLNPNDFYFLTVFHETSLKNVTLEWIVQLQFDCSLVRLIPSDFKYCSH